MRKLRLIAFQIYIVAFLLGVIVVELFTRKKVENGK